MSSSNSERITLIEETTYGVTPVAGNFSTARFTSDSISGTPETTESQQIRTDRMSSGQILTSLSVGGDLAFELAKEPVLDLLLSSAMLSTWVTSATVTVALEVDTSTKTIERASGNWNGEVIVGDILTLAGGLTANNTQVMVTEIVSATVIKFTGPDTMVSDATVASFKVADKISIGVTKKSFSMEKAFLDLATKAINYRGMLVTAMNLTIAYGEIATGSFTFAGNGYQPVSTASDFITFGRTITAAATTNSMNGSVDMPFIASSAVGALDTNVFCIQSVELSLNNNPTPQNCIGRIAAKDISLGTAQIEVNISAYLSDDNWDIIPKKLTQEPFALGFLTKNIDGFYGFFLPAVQVSFDDPSSGGANQDIILTMSGTAKVGANGESSLTIYRS